MRSLTRIISLSVIIFAAAWISGCSESNPIAAFEPEIVNNPDSFEFQITDADNVSTTLSYAWINSGDRASIDHSTVVTDGSGRVALTDASGNTVYSSELKASGTEQAASGTPGTWTVTVTFSGFDGTSNFRVQKL